MGFDAQGFFESIFLGLGLGIVGFSLALTGELGT